MYLYDTVLFEIKLRFCLLLKKNSRNEKFKIIFFAQQFIDLFTWGKEFRIIEYEPIVGRAFCHGQKQSILNFFSEEYEQEIRKRYELV